jgi:hypothetical protein
LSSIDIPPTPLKKGGYRALIAEKLPPFLRGALIE